MTGGSFKIVLNWAVFTTRSLGCNIYFPKKTLMSHEPHESE
jgi:hypothetical protein